MYEVWAQEISFRIDLGCRGERERRVVSAVKRVALTLN